MLQSDERDSIFAYGVYLKPLEKEKIELVRGWRNDPQVAQYLIDQQYISSEMQQRWYEKVSGDPRQAHYIIFFKGQEIGLAYLATKYATQLLGAEIVEPGFYLAPGSYRGNALAFAPAMALNDHCFKTLGVKVLRARVMPDNTAALRFNTLLGYQNAGQDEGQLEVQELTKPDYYLARKQLARFFK